jgi:hypothetical protein
MVMTEEIQKCINNLYLVCDWSEHWHPVEGLGKRSQSVSQSGVCLLSEQRRVGEESL